MQTFRQEDLPQGVDTTLGLWLRRQFDSIRRAALDAVDYVYLRKTTAAPQRSIAGELRWADGTNWDPRSLGTSFRKGLYWYDSDEGVWQRVISLPVGGTVTQPTSKSTAVTLNTLTGQVVTNNATLNAGTSVAFTVNNNLLTGNEAVVANIFWNSVSPLNYSVRAAIGSGAIQIDLKNESAVNLSEAVTINFTVIPSSTS